MSAECRTWNNSDANISPVTWERLCTEFQLQSVGMYSIMRFAPLFVHFQYSQYNNTDIYTNPILAWPRRCRFYAVLCFANLWACISRHSSRLYSHCLSIANHQRALQPQYRISNLPPPASSQRIKSNGAHHNGVFWYHNTTNIAAAVANLLNQMTITILYLDWVLNGIMANMTWL